MRKQKRQPGMTLTEILVVVAVMVLLLGISVPTAQHLMDSFESSTGVKHLINAALSNARAVAVRNHAYAGVRFQRDGDSTAMILIIHDPEMAAYGFRDVTGRKPMKLPKDTTVDACSVVFSPVGKLTVHTVQYVHGGVQTSVQSLNITGKNTAETEYISPYTGELVMEYREESP